MSRRAIIIGASSGIGAALSRDLSTNGYEVGLAARRLELLEEVAKNCNQKTYIQRMDLSDLDSALQALEALINKMGDVELFIISSGVGFDNPNLEWEPEASTIVVNVTGFTSIVGQIAKYLEQRKGGHLVGISSVVAIRGHGHAPAYGASKAYQSSYLRSLRHKFNLKGLPIYVTEILPGFVETALAKGPGLFWVAPVNLASKQILVAILRRKKTAYITKKWSLIAFLLWILPDCLYKRM